MRATEHIAKSPSTPTAGLFATLRAVFHAGGSRAPKTSRRLVLSVLAVTLAALAWSAAPALADTAPSVTIEPASAVAYTSAHVSGTVNPNGGPSATAWIFEYSKEPVTEGWTPATGGEFTGIQATELTPIAVEANLEGLQPNTSYQVRLVATNAGGETISAEPNPSFMTKAVTAPTVTIAPVSTFTATTAHFSGTVNPNAPGAEPQDPAFNTVWHFECSPGCPGLEGGEVLADNSPHEVTADAKGLLPTTVYTVTLVASNLGGESTAGPETFTTPIAPPTVTGESIAKLTATEVTLSAQIDPGGASTTYEVEYEPGKSTAEQALPASKTPAGVQQTLTGLTPATEYHVRFLAHNSAGSGEGTLLAFTTPSSAGPSALTLPDNRAYELVSPVHDQSNQEVYLPMSGFVSGFDVEDISSLAAYQASPDGNAVAYGGDPPSAGGSGAQGNSLGNQFLATRTAHGWEATDVTPPASSLGTEFEAFSSDLSFAILRSHNNPTKGFPPLTEDAPVRCTVLYTRANGDYHAMFTTTETPGFCGARPLFAAANKGTAAVPANSHLLFETEAALTPPAVESEEEEKYNLYDSVGGQARLVNILPGSSEPDPYAVFGGPAPAADLVSGGSSSEERQSDFSNAISPDGSRIFWTDRKTGDLYVRENDTTTVPVSQGAATFWTASPDGRYVFYTEAGALWRFDVATETRTQLAAPSAGVQGVIGINETGEPGSYIYFVAKGALGPGSQARSCIAAGSATGQEQKEQGEEEEGHVPAGRGCNLYVLHSGEQPTFIAALLPGDDHYPRLEFAANGDWQGNLGNRTAEVTPDGHHLAFMSRVPLTGYDNVVHKHGGSQEGKIEAAHETFVYDATSGLLACASCNPTGEPPSQPAVFGGMELPAGALEPVGWKDKAFMHRWINEEGTDVFFSTADSLVPQDTNGREDVYEWEREGPPDSSCPETTPRRRNGGCIFVLSGAGSTDASTLVDVSANGGDVFFTTRAKLVSQDRNDNMDLYDARVGGGFPEASLACTGTGCQGVPSAPPIFATPSSATFNGVGNFPAPPPAKGKTAAQIRAEKLAKALKACKRDRAKKRRAACEKQARKRYRASTAKKAGNERRAGR